MQKETTSIDTVGAKAFGSDTPQDIRLIIANAIRIFLGFLGFIFLVLLIWAGYKYMTSRGNEDKVEESVTQIRNAIIGIAIIMISWSIATYIVKCTLDITGASQVWMCNFYSY
jgi:TRAP-type C4-dicarboxylate transport system permease small subunit